MSLALCISHMTCSYTSLQPECMPTFDYDPISTDVITRTSAVCATSAKMMAHQTQEELGLTCQLFHHLCRL